MRKKIYRAAMRSGWFPKLHVRGDKQAADKLGIPSWLRRYTRRYS